MSSHCITPFSFLKTHPQFHYHKSAGLMMGDVALKDIAQNVSKPCWVLSYSLLKERALAFKHAFEKENLNISYHFAIKAQSHQAALRTLQACGFGADVVSGGEITRALRASIAPQEIVFSGVGKTNAELEMAISSGVGQINVESIEEIARLETIAQKLSKKASIALRINPDIDAGTHAKITTGKADNKFGIAYQKVIDVYHYVQTLSHVEIIGLAVHLGSQLMSLEPLIEGYKRVAELVDTLEKNGFHVTSLDCGGGLGIAYQDQAAPTPNDLAKIIKQTLGHLKLHLKVEPGRWIAGPAGVLLAQVTEVKHALKDFIILDAGMNDLIRPALYNSWHGLLPLNYISEATPLSPFDVVGPICESSDVFAYQRYLPDMQAGDFIMIADTGAYGSVMSSNYNSHPFCASVMIKENEWEIIRPAQTIDALIFQDHIPSWIKSDK